MLFEILSSIEVTASAAVIVATLAFALAATPRLRLLVASAATVWFVVVVLLGATLALNARGGVGTPGLGAAVALPIVAICLAFFTAPSVRAALFAIPLRVLVAVNVARVLGVSFVLLYAANRLPAPFAPSAGWGDIIVGIAAAPVAWLVGRHGERARALTLAWNTIGVIDLIAAIGFGATSVPGPLQIFTGAPDSAIMTTLPWILIPGFLVPSYLALHIAIFYRLSRTSLSALAPGGRSESVRADRARRSTGVLARDARPIGVFGGLYRILDHMSA